LAPSNIPCLLTSRLDPNYQIKEMTPDDIQRVINDFVNGAVLAVETGYKILQVYAAHGFIFINFLSPNTNKRTDEYDGSVENRCRFLVKTIEAFRKKLGNIVVIDVRLSVDEFVDEGLVPGDYEKITPMLEKAGADMLNASLTIFESQGLSS
jgi:2,4-dienoyl-CoA reductase-like NADH-dependent reductase (Old Yellow Enzyme family)